MNKDNITLSIITALESEEGIWMLDANYPIIYLLEIENRIILEFYVIPQSDNKKYAQYLGMIIYNDYIYILPDNGYYIQIFDIRNRKFTNQISQKGKSGVFLGGYVYEKNVYCIPFRHVIGCINTKDFVAEEINWREYLGVGKNYYVNDFAIQKNIISMVIPKTNKIFMLDCKSNKIASVSVGNPENSYISICSTNNKWFICEQNKKQIQIVDLDERSIIKSTNIGYESVKMYAAYDKYIIVDDVNTDKWSMYDTQLNLISEYIFEKEELLRNDALVYRFGHWFLGTDSKVHCIDDYNHLLTIELDGEIKKENIFVDSSVILRALQENNRINNDGTVFESYVYNLDAFLNKNV